MNHRLRAKLGVAAGAMGLALAALLAWQGTARQAGYQGPAPSPATVSTRDVMTDANARSPHLDVPATRLVAEAFEVSLTVDLPAASAATAATYGETLTPGGQTSVELIVLEQAEFTTYLFRMSENPSQGCFPQAACAAPAQGNVATVELPLPRGRLSPGTYAIAGPGQATQGHTIAADAVVIAARSLYSDPSHGQLGCQSWGSGEFTVAQAVYDADGNLTHLTATLTQRCAQTTPMPPAVPGAPAAATALIDSYGLRFSWRLQLVPLL